MGSYNFLSCLNFGVLSLLLFHLLTSSSANAQDIDLLKKQKPIQSVEKIYSDSAKFYVEIPNPSGGPFLKCNSPATHVVQFLQVTNASNYNPNKFGFSHNVEQKPDGFIIKGLEPNRDYRIRVACQFTEASRPGEWSEPAQIHTTFKLSPTSNTGNDHLTNDHDGHHHHHHSPTSDQQLDSRNSNTSGGESKEHDHSSGDHEHHEHNPDPDKKTNNGSSSKPLLNQVETTILESLEQQSAEADEPVLPIPSMLRQPQSDDSEFANDGIEKKFWGVFGEWANLTCNSSLLAPLAFQWIQVDPNGIENMTIEERFGVRIINEENLSLLMFIVKTEDMFGQFICEATEIASGQKEIQKVYLHRGRRPPKIHLKPEWVLMTTASFKVLKIFELNDNPNNNGELNNKDLIGDELPLIGFVVWIKPSCHILGPWLLANITEHNDGFEINNLQPNEGYYVKAALRNTGAVGDYGEYWKIRTSAAVLLKSNGAAHGSLGISCLIFVLMAFFL